MPSQLLIYISFTTTLTGTIEPTMKTPSFPCLTIFLLILQITSYTCNSSSDDLSAPLHPNNGRSPSRAAGRGFGTGAIDLGGVEVYEALHLKEIWKTQSGGVKGLGATFYEPDLIPDGFHVIGHHCKAKSTTVLTTIIIAKDTTGEPSNGALKSPIDYTLIWSSKGMNVSRSKDGYIWYPIAPDGYKAVGNIVTTSPKKPSLDKVKCVRSDFTDLTKVGRWIWGHDMQKGLSTVNLHTTKPKSRVLSVPTGTFLALNGLDTQELACLKMVKSDPYSAMPNAVQISTIIKTYAPFVYLHTNEEYFPSSVLWYFENGAKLHKLGQLVENVTNDGDNLPNNGTADNAFLDLPLDQPSKERLQKGSLPDVVNYIHVKSALGGTHTDFVIWFFYPFNGASRLQFGPFVFDFRRIGEHVADWEHITLRVDNYHGTLKLVYLSQHSRGLWLTPSEFELVNGSRPVVYASLHDHAHYATPTVHIRTSGIRLNSDEVQELYDEYQMMTNSSGTSLFVDMKHFKFGLRDDAEKSDNVIDVASTYNVICADHMKLGSEPWVNFSGRWGPKITYEIKEELTKMADDLSGTMKKLFIKALKRVPAEVFGQEGPQGPKQKDNWYGDERI